MTNKEKLLEQIKTVENLDDIKTVGAFKQIHGVAFNGLEFDFEFLDKVKEAYKERGVTDFSDLFGDYMQQYRATEEEEQKAVADWFHGYNKPKKKAKTVIEAIKNEYYAYNDKGNPTKPLHDKIAHYVAETHHIIVISSRPYIYDNGVYRLDNGGKITKSLIKPMLLEKDKTYNIIQEIYKLLIDIPNINFTYDEVNKYSIYWINFKNGMLDTQTLQLLEHSPDYYSINQIPHNYEPDAEYKNTVADVFIRDIIPDKADRDMFYTYCGYCMTRDTNLQKFLVLIGAPGTGKSTLLNLVIDTIGEENMQGLTIKDISENKFSGPLLVGKLINICADLPKEPLKAVDTMKKLTGQDGLQCEIKHGANFYVRYMYVRLAFSTNEMPISLDEQSDAWYRRLLMLNIPKKGKHIENLQQELRKSIPAFIALCVRRLNCLYETKTKTIDSPNSVKMVAEYHHDSDSVQSWLDDCCEKVQGARAETKEAYQLYCKYCDENDISTISARKFHSNLKTKGYKVKQCRISGTDKIPRYFINLCVTPSRDSNTSFTPLSDKENPFSKEFNKM